MVLWWVVTDRVRPPLPKCLLLQKRPTLTPAQVKAILRGTATDVTVGVSAMGQPAGPGIDAATGSGLVHALNAWLSA